MSDQEDPLAEARRQREADLLKLDDMDDDELDYLARVDELEDPLTDGIECDADSSL